MYVQRCFYKFSENLTWFGTQIKWADSYSNISRQLQQFNVLLKDFNKIDKLSTLARLVS